ncbi:hypothetical protein AAFF_G00185540 [Aldrovandia affinis]|uniref:Reverse transcriptase n=1 Tax=Aldrovandia affinis TaxID=143900 RepID=A0AAD7RJY1_9TELE|nr:hypothetical protein AAFF_G00185540 [Aldrovandia affinis]
MNTLSSYLKNWHLKLSVDKTVSTMFHLYNKEATREMNIMVDNARLQFHPSPTYLGVKLDRTLSFKQHLDSVKAAMQKWGLSAAANGERRGLKDLDDDTLDWLASTELKV